MQIMTSENIKALLREMRQGDEQIIGLVKIEYWQSRANQETVYEINGQEYTLDCAVEYVRARLALDTMATHSPLYTHEHYNALCDIATTCEDYLTEIISVVQTPENETTKGDEI